jgi:protocatechuate 3,4-dioxygenase beta subunit
VAFSCLVGIAYAEPTTQQSDDASPLAPPVERSSEPVAADAPTISVAGTVLDTDGKPVALAIVALRAKIGGQLYNIGVPHNRDVIARTRSDVAGRFRFDSVPIPPRLAAEVFNPISPSGKRVELIAWANGRAFTWSDVSLDHPLDGVRLVLAPEAKVTGTVRDQAGSGVAGVRIRATNATRAKRQYDAFFRQPGDICLTGSEISFDVETDLHGHFELSNLPSDYRLAITIADGGFAKDFFFLDTSADGHVDELRSSNGRQQMTRVMRSPVDITVDARKPVTVRVTSGGVPVRGGGLQTVLSDRKVSGRNNVDGQGVARTWLSPPAECIFMYVADPFDPGLNAIVTRQIEPADTAIEIALPAPRWLPGRVVDADTGAGIAGAYVAYRVDESDQVRGSQAVTVDDGTFRLPVLPGMGKLMFAHEVYGYLVPTARIVANGRLEVATIDIPESGPIEPVTLSLTRGLVVRGVVRDASGNPVPDAAVRGRNVGRPFLAAESTSDAAGRFVLSGLSPLAKSIITAGTAQGGARAIIDADLKHPEDESRFVDISLDVGKLPVITGRILRDSQPQSGVLIRLSGSLPGQQNMRSLYMETQTDSEGRYVVGGLEPGDQYSIEIDAGDGSTAPGFVHQMPYVQTVAAGKNVLELPDANLVTNGQSLRGRVLDPQGNPVPGITVSARLADSKRSLSRVGNAPPPWVTTNERGEFELSPLPDLAIELMACRANPKGGIIRFPSMYCPTRNQEDIRIRFDPTLDQDVEDLDKPAIKAHQ